MYRDLIPRIEKESGIDVRCLASGILVTAETPEQAADRAGGKHGNRGWDAAQAAIESANVIKQLGPA